MNNERFPSTIKLFFSVKHLESSLHWWIDSEKNNMILIFSAIYGTTLGVKIILLTILIMIRSLKLLYLGDNCIVFQALRM